LEGGKGAVNEGVAGSGRTGGLTLYWGEKAQGGRTGKWRGAQSKEHLKEDACKHFRMAI